MRSAQVCRVLVVGLALASCGGGSDGEIRPTEDRQASGGDKTDAKLVTGFEVVASGADWSSMTFAGDRLWVGTHDGVLRLDPVTGAEEFRLAEVGGGAAPTVSACGEDTVAAHSSGQSSLELIDTASNQVTEIDLGFLESEDVSIYSAGCWLGDRRLIVGRTNFGDGPAAGTVVAADVSHPEDHMTVDADVAGFAGQMVLVEAGDGDELATLDLATGGLKPLPEDGRCPCASFSGDLWYTVETSDALELHNAGDARTIALGPWETEVDLFEIDGVPWAVVDDTSAKRLDLQGGRVAETLPFPGAVGDVIHVEQGPGGPWLFSFTSEMVGEVSDSEEPQEVETGAIVRPLRR